MTTKYGPLGFEVGDRYRHIPEARIVDMLLLAGWVYELDSSSAADACRLALESWVQRGLGFRRTANGERLFDPFEVSNFLKRAGLDGRDDFWAERYVRTGRRLVTDLADKGRAALSNGGELPFRIEFKRSFPLRQVVAGSRLRLRMSLPLEGDYLRNLEVTPFAEAFHETQMDVGRGRLEVRMTASGENEASIGASLSFSALPQEPHPGQSMEEPDRALYLRQREGLIVVSERISALARSLVGDDRPSLEAVRAYWDYINRELICGFVHYDQIDAASPCDWVLDSGWFDCQLGAALLISLCRARGIPARLVGGHVLFRLAPTRHYWAEVWIEHQGWTPFDFLSWDLSRGSRDPEWRDHFFGRIDYRMTTERMPREFTGAIGVPIPEVWSLLQVEKSGGLETCFMDASGLPVYTDTIRVRE